MSHGFIRHYDSMEFLPQGSGDFLFCIKYHSRYSNTFPAYIDCCVLIPVHSISACTLINAITQPQILFYVSTTATGFGARIPAVNANQFLPGAFHFICQKIREHSPTIVMNTLSETHILTHFFHIQIFHAHDIINFIDITPRFLPVFAEKFSFEYLRKSHKIPLFSNKLVTLGYTRIRSSL